MQEASNQRRLIERWESWIEEMETHPLDQFEYLGALELRDELAWCLEVGDDQVAMDAVSDLDARFEVVTTEDGRFARHFAAQAGIGWWWQRMPADPEAQRYITQDWR